MCVRFTSVHERGENQNYRWIWCSAQVRLLAEWKGDSIIVWNFAWDWLASGLYAATATTFLMKFTTVKCHYNACHYNANASLTRSSLGSQTAPTCPHDHPRVAQHMGYRCEIIAVWSATAAMTPLCSHTNGIKQRYPTCWLCQYSRFMIDLRSNTLIIHLRCSENAINRPIWLPDARMLKTISVAIKLT